jgi:hypothetical protein
MHEAARAVEGRSDTALTRALGRLDEAARAARREREAAVAPGEYVIKYRSSSKCARTQL